MSSGDVSQITAIQQQMRLNSEAVQEAKLMEVQREIQNVRIDRIEKENSSDKTPTRSSIILA